jgi:diguanylate cyclase (GGDEF)-like protein
MISLKKYLDTEFPVAELSDGHLQGDLLEAMLSAYRSALLEMGSCSLDACPALGVELKTSLGKLQEHLAGEISRETVEATERSVLLELQNWGRRTARHYQEKTGEVKEILLAMAHTAESVGARDQRYARQVSEVTTRLKRIANLEDLSEIRASIERSASELKTSIDRLTAEGKAAIQQLRTEVSNYQAKLEAAEQVAFRDALTGLGSRLCVENQIERRLATGLRFCVAIADIDGFKQVNDRHGHLVGDELLKQFADRLKSVCRSTDLIGRWGGDEFILLLYCGLPDARMQIERLREWVCGSYTVHGASGPVRLRLDASIGLAESVVGEPLKALLARADGDMYQNKAASRPSGVPPKQ